MTQATLAYLNRASTKLTPVADPRVELWQAELHRYCPLIERIIWQTEYRVFFGEATAAGDKIVSRFEPQGQSRRRIGHELNSITGRSGF